MATYKEIKGVTVQTLDSDPVENVGSWSSGGDLNTAREALAGAGTQTAGLGFGGYTLPGQTANTEEYNGTSWSAVTCMITARDSLVGAGAQNAGLVYGGSEPSVSTKTEEYDARPHEQDAWEFEKIAMITFLETVGEMGNA